MLGARLSVARTEGPQRQQTQRGREDEPVVGPEIGRGHGPEPLQPRHQPLRQRLTAIQTLPLGILGEVCGELSLRPFETAARCEG